MMHTEQTVAELLAEPEDGERLVVQDSPTEYKVIWRDDAEAKSWGGDHDTERWFAAHDQDPMEMYQHVKYAERVYRLGGEPVAAFRG